MGRGTKEGVSPLDFRDVKKSEYKLFFSYFKPHRKLFFADLICAVFVAAVDIVFPVISRFLLNKLLPQYSVNPNGIVKSFFLIIALCFLMYIFRTMAQWFVTFFGHVFGVAVEKDMRRDIFTHIENQSFSFFDKNRTGKIMSRVTTDLFEISELAHHGPEDLLISLLTLVGSFVVMFSIRWQLAVIVFISLPVMIFLTYSSRKKLMSTSKGVKSKTAEINAGIESSISGARVTKVFTNESYEINKFEEYNQEFFNSKKYYYKAMAGMHSKMEFTTHILSVVILGVGGYFIMAGKMTLGDLVAANMFVAAFLQPIRRLTNFIEQFSTGMAGFLRFTEIMDTHTETVDSPSAKELTGVKGNIQFNDVCFSYETGQTVLDHISFSVDAGKTFAIAGPSGGGKTTLCSLLARFYEISSGTITIDGENIKNFTLKSLRQQIGFVQQDVFYFCRYCRKKHCLRKTRSNFYRNCGSRKTGRNLR